jgi:hypothetical protein
VEVIIKGQRGYSEAKKIFNPYKEVSPSSIYYCENATDVSSLVRFCSDTKLPFKVRNSGHNHEGLCTGENTVVIDVSKIKDFELTRHKDEVAVWVGTGLKNKEITDALSQFDLVVNGGACEGVGIGGLVLGGGWNLYARTKGLTCDSVVAMEVVLANGNIETISSEYKKDLFEAMLGAGGGNFAVATHFLIKTFELGSFHSFESEGVVDRFGAKTLMRCWVEYQRLGGDKASSFLRIFGLPNNKYGYRVAGNIFVASAGSAEDEFKNFIVASGIKVDYSKIKFTLLSGMNSDLYMMEGKGSYYAEDFAELIDKKKKIYSCKSPTSHKVTSAFPRDCSGSGKLIDVVLDYLGRSISVSEDPKCYCIVSLHALGGRIKEFGGNSFSYNGKDFMLQIQSWWDSSVEKNEIYIKWVEGLRKALDKQSLIEGAFVNFIDLDLLSAEVNPYYSAEVSEKLLLVKHKYDPSNIFESGLRLSVLDTFSKH